MLYLLPATAADSGGLDDTDIALIRLLQINGRAPFSELAKRTGLTERQVARRVDQLLTSGLIQIAPVCNPAKLGLKSIAMIGVRLTGGTRAEAFVTAILEQGFIDYAAVTLGAVDVLVEVMARSDGELRALVEDHILARPDVAQVDIHPYVGLSYQLPVWEDVQRDDEAEIEIYESETDPLDETDRRLVALLSRNGRATFQSLAEALEISESYVRKRYKALVGRGDMQVHALTNPVSLGYDTHCWLKMRLDPGQSLAAATRRIAALEHVAYVAVCTGRADLLVEVICRNKAELRDFIGERLGRGAGVRCTESLLCSRLFYRSVPYNLFDGYSATG